MIAVAFESDLGDGILEDFSTVEEAREWASHYTFLTGGKAEVLT